jgi:transcriptional regulator with XRE-family HTH domain
MARLLGLSVTGFQNYEGGSRQPGADTLDELGKLAEGAGLPNLQMIFDAAFEREIKGSSGPTTSEEKAWANAIVQLIRWGGLSKDFKGKIVELIEHGAELGDENFNRRLIELKVLAATSAEEKLDILAADHIKRTGASQALAYAAVLKEHPTLAALIEFEARWKKRGKGKSK